MQWTSWAAVGTLVLVGGVVVYSSLTTSSVRCEICVVFGGREACRAVEGATEEETRRAAQTNACALVASGVTETMACERTEPSRAACGPR